MCKHNSGRRGLRSASSQSVGGRSCWPVAFVVRKKEQLVLRDRPAKSEPGEVRPIRGFLSGVDVIEGITRGSLVRAVEDIGAPVKTVRATLGNDVDRGAGRKAKLRGKGIAIDLKFLNRFRRNIEARSSGAVLIFATVNGDEIVTTVAAADRKAGALEAGNATRKLAPRGR